MRRLIFALMLAAGPLLAEDFTFEVASVKPTGNATKGSSIWTNETGFRAENTPLKFLIQFAYNAQDYQIIGAPSWVKDDGWDINAKNEVAEVDKVPLQDRKSVEARTERMRSRVSHMLEDRFQLKVRQEEKQLPVYALTVDKAGLKLESVKEPKGNMRSNRSNAAGTIHGEGIALDTVTVVKRLQDRGELELVGGPNRVALLAEIVPSPVNGWYSSRPESAVVL